MIDQPVWRPAPSRLDITKNMVDVWRVVLDPEVSLKTLRASARMREDVGLAVRDILSRYLGLPPDDLPIVRQAGGKPCLQGSHPDLRFNLSHTRGMALLAVMAATDVGIDIEVDRPIENRIKLARRVFRADQQDELGKLPESVQSHRFLQMWTAMEAGQKCAGRGIFDCPVNEGTLQLFGFIPAIGWIAHLAVGSAGKAPVVRYFDWASARKV
jgi:4'-phosphopantetheinyl transferase